MNNPMNDINVNSTNRMNPNAKRVVQSIKTTAGKSRLLDNKINVVLILIALVAVGYGLFEFFKHQYVLPGVNSSLIQAVDVSANNATASGDQIYFGTIKSINPREIVMEDVFYIPATNTNSTSKGINLLPISCQLDKPINEITINRSSVMWWENLQSSSSIASAIKSYKSSGKSTNTCPSA